MRPIGFSTGAIAKGDFETALDLLRQTGIKVVEISALRLDELLPLAQALPNLDLSDFAVVSLHAPTAYPPEDEAMVARTVLQMSHHGFAVTVHPDTIVDWALWRDLGDRLLIENMDRRKPAGRFAEELEQCFNELPDAGFCFDMAHARQVDPSMTEAVIIARQFADRMKLIHISEVNSASRHERLSITARVTFARVARYIQEGVPAVIESVVQAGELMDELEIVRRALTAEAAPSVTVARP